MEVRIYGSDGRFCTSPDEGLPPTDAFMDLKETCIYQQPIFIPSLEITENQGRMQPGFHGSPKTTSANKPMGYSMGKGISGGRTLTSQKELFREEEWNSKVSSPVIDTGSQDSSFMVLDVKLGRLAKIMDVKNDKCPIDAGSSSSVPSTPLAKKIRSTGLNSQIPYCQVYGCSMDLSSSKTYHKKHKVCEIHSKTSKVVVNGREQRFCQQCSRFHLLAEFDDGKRSCRRRLAGHNERRRKPQLDTHPGRTGKLFQSNYGEGFLDASLLVRTSFLPTEHANGILDELGHENADWCQHVKVDDEYASNGQATVNGQLLTEAFLSNYSTVKQFSSIHTTGSPSWNISYEHGDEVHLGYASNGSNIEAFPRIRESIRALSLLSSQSQNASGYSSAIPVVHPVILPDGRAQNSITQLSDKAPLVASQASTTVASDKFSSGMNSKEYEHMCPLVSDASNAVNFEFQKGAAYQGSQIKNTGEPLSTEPGNTVNLIQLSSLLQTAEEQRMSSRNMMP